MAATEKRNTHRKALTINLDPKCCDSVANIGVGRKVLRRLLIVPGTFGTVAKLFSTCDKEVSDGLCDFSAAISRRGFAVPHLPIAAPTRIPHANREAA